MIHKTRTQAMQIGSMHPCHTNEHIRENYDIHTFLVTMRRRIAHACRIVLVINARNAGEAATAAHHTHKGLAVIKVTERNPRETSYHSHASAY